MGDAVFPEVEEAAGIAQLDPLGHEEDERAGADTGQNRRYQIDCAARQDRQADEIQRKCGRRECVRPQHADPVHQTGRQKRDPPQSGQNQRDQVDATMLHEKERGHQQQAHHREHGRREIHDLDGRRRADRKHGQVAEDSGLRGPIVQRGLERA